MHIRKGDLVEVICGDDAKTRGKVLSVDRKNKQLVVEGVNRVYKHVRRGHPKSPQGGRLHTELKIDASNVMLICPQTGKPTRVGVRFAADGTKELFAKVSGAKMRDIAPAKKKV
ncbi:MAG: 50S ribosomal protein L24 [Planctomyces sp.]|jgi:large subunit ribosomal protein L24